MSAREAEVARLHALAEGWRSEDRNFADPPADVAIWAKHRCADEVLGPLAARTKEAAP